MSNPVELAGVIGTWVAVFLALVALLGLLPAYFLYKRSRSVNAAAIAAVDDPQHTFVSGTRVFGVLLAQKFKIPDLRAPPPLAVLENATLDKMPSERLLGPTKPGTAWVEFAQLIAAVFPGFDVGGKTLLSIEHGEARLPVHKTWLLALGILHRYSARLDHGLPLGAAVDAAADGGLVQDARLSGLSGYLDYRGFGASMYRFEDDYAISFEMHHLPTIRESLTRDHLSFLALALLFRGYVTRDCGILLKGRIASWELRSIREEVQQVIATVKSEEIRENFLRVLPGINARANRKLSFKTTPVPKEIRKNCKPGEVPMSNFLRHGYYRLGDWRMHNEHFEIWILRKDAYYFVLGYLELAPSPYGFLFDVQHDLVVMRMLKTNTVGVLLDLATLWWPKLPKETLTDGVTTKLQKGLEKVSHNDLLAVQWSRRVMQAIVSLDEALSAIVQHENLKVENTGIMWKSVGAIYACNEDFQQSLGRYLNGMLSDGGDSSQTNIYFDIGGGNIKVPGEDGAEFPFDFNHLFPETMMTPNTPGSPNSITPVIAMFACLQGQFRAIAWKMSLSPAHLKNLDSEIRETCHVSASKFHSLSPRSPVPRIRSIRSSLSYLGRPHNLLRREPSSYFESQEGTSSRSDSNSSSRSFSTAQSGNARLGQGGEGQEPMDI